ncbi:SagB/ThcOx family dehydrogenase [Chloroflexota bacterium]
MWKYAAYILFCLQILVLLVMPAGCAEAESNTTPEPVEKAVVQLPEPQRDGGISIEQSLLRRRSVRDYSGEPLTLSEVSQLLWAAQGITDERGFRTAPSAGGLYPLELYVVAGDVAGLPPAVYHYMPQNHRLVLVAEGDKRKELAGMALSQSCVAEGGMSVVMTAFYTRTTGKYGERGIRYVHIEAGHAAQNLCLQAASLDLGLVTVGAFHDEQVVGLLHLAEDEQPLYVIPVGRK